MDISGLLNTFATCLRFYIEEFDRIFLHVSRNLPLLGEQIGKYVQNVSELMEREPDNLKPYSRLMEDLADVEGPVFEIIVELQKQDIINQQLIHLASAVDDVRQVTEEYKSYFENIGDWINDGKYHDDYRHLLTLVDFLLNNIEKQMLHINRDLNILVDRMEQRFSDIHTKIKTINNDRKDLDRKNSIQNRTMESIYSGVENYSRELELYGGFFGRLRQLQSDLNREVELCGNLKKEVEKSGSLINGFLPLKKCRFANTIIQKIVDKLSVEEEREALRQTYSELHIEEGFTRDIVLF